MEKNITQVTELLKDFGKFNNWKGVVDLYFTQKQLREMSKLLGISLKGMFMSDIKKMLKL